jgi:hypothetical protein
MGLFKKKAQQVKTYSGLLRAINIRGLQLGMSRENVERLLTGVLIKPVGELGEESASFIPSQQSPTNSSFENIASIYVGFWHNQVVNLIVSYVDESSPWSSTEEFASKVAATYGFPDNWVKQDDLGWDCRFREDGDVGITVRLKYNFQSRMSDPTIRLEDVRSARKLRELNEKHYHAKLREQEQNKSLEEQERKSKFRL